MNRKYYERCGDCGGEVGEIEADRRPDICAECWERRMWLARNIDKVATYFGMAKFQALQKSMAYKTGTAKGKILRMAKELPTGKNK